MPLVGQAALDANIFGSANDGSATYSGIVDISNYSGTGTNPGDLYYNTFTTTGSAVVTAHGTRIFARQKITIGAGTVLTCAGKNASTGSTSGATAVAGVGSLGIGTAGGSGTSGGAGTNGGDFTGLSYKGVGGQGGAGGISNTSVAGGSGGNLNQSVLQQQWAGYFALMNGFCFYNGSCFGIGGGSGGGGGGGVAGIPPNFGMGGGAGGSVIMLAAPIIEIDGTVNAAGGSGAADSGVGTGYGSGGGGGGGVIILLYSQLILGGGAIVTAVGGTGGTNAVGGAAGANGGNGLIICINGLSTAKPIITNGHL